MKGKLWLCTRGGRTASVEVDVTNKGVNLFEIEAQLPRLEVELALLPGTETFAFVSLPSKMNLPGFTIDE